MNAENRDDGTGSMNKAILPIFLLCAALWCIPAAAAPGYCPYDINCSIWYTSLSEKEQSFFDSLYDAVWLGKASVNLPRTMTIDEANQVFFCLYFECPELCTFLTYNNAFVNPYYYNGEELYSEVRLFKKAGVSHRRQTLFIRQVSEIAADLHSVYDVHQYVCRKYSYKTGDSDWDLYADADRTMSTGLANCAGYSRTMTMLCHFAGLKCSTVASLPEISHSWNVISVNGKYTIVDSTWDDAGDTAIYDYFGVSSEGGEGSYVPDREWCWWVPHCDDVQSWELMQSGDPAVSGAAGAAAGKAALVVSGTHGSSIYRVYEADLSWQDAEAFCRKLGGHLASIADAQEMDFVLRLAEASRRDNFWIGLYRSDQDCWIWTDGTEYTFSPWDSGQPDNYQNIERYVRFPNKDLNYTYWTAAKGRWNDTCGYGDAEAPLSSFGFVCELP